MPSLRDIQEGFASEVLAREGTSVPLPARASGATARDGTAVYRRTIRANYRNAMSATYPVVCRIVGTSFFLAAVDAYGDAHPSRSGDLNEYGDAFGAFLDRYPPAVEMPYLADVARLEWAIDEVNRAADSTFAPDAVLVALSHVRTEALPQVRLRIESSCRFIASAFPLLRIWQVNQADYDGDMRVDFDAGGDRLRVRREPGNAMHEGGDEGGVLIERLDAGRFEWLSTLARQATLGEALERAVKADPLFDLQAALQEFVADGSIDGVEGRSDA